ncbi:MAG: GNAT family N-acetyltransferase [Cytophagales bacterium]|nr:GNAT family N-acetyltransferase [Cytophagales bacterium]
MAQIVLADFVEVSHQAERFFQLLPSDWAECIAPYWPSYQNNTRVYILESEGRALAGGMVFGSLPPDFTYYEAEARPWFQQGYLYIAYLWVAESSRGQGLGSLWMEELLQLHPAQRYWLVIEDYLLTQFYEPLGFRLVSHFNKTKWMSGSWLADSGCWLMLF